LSGRGRESAHSTGCATHLLFGPGSTTAIRVEGFASRGGSLPGSGRRLASCRCTIRRHEFLANWNDYDCRRAGMRRLCNLLCCLIWLITAPSAWAERVADVVMFTSDYCSCCLPAQESLIQLNVSFGEYNIERSAKAKDVFERLGGRGTPFFLIEGKRVQGFDPDQFEQLTGHLKPAR